MAKRNKKPLNWICKKCNQRNSERMTHCKRCGLNKNINPNIGDF